MDIDKLEVVIRAIELGSLSKAANEFLYTPSAVSHILDAIENQIGIKFIKRSYTGISVENGCEEIVNNLKKIVKLQKQTKQLAFDIKQKKKVLTVATYASLSKRLMTELIKNYSKIDLDIHINIIVVDNMKKAFEDGCADILVGEKIERENICWEKLIVDPYVAVFPKQFKISDTEIKKDEIYMYPFIKTNDGKITNYIDERKIKYIVRVNSHDDSSVIYMVKEGLGIAILPMLSVSEDKDVHCVKLEPGFIRELGLIYRESDFNEKIELRNFVNYIKSFDFKHFSV